MAADLLAKAEAATAALGQQMAELLSQQQQNGTVRRGDGDDVSRLEAERLEAARRAESAEAEAELLRKQLELLAEDVQRGSDPMQTYNVKVLEELAAAQSLATAAQTELTELRRQNKSFQKQVATLRKSSSTAVVNGKVNGAKGGKEVRVLACACLLCNKRMMHDLCVERCNWTHTSTSTCTSIVAGLSACCSTGPRGGAGARKRGPAGSGGQAGPHPCAQQKVYRELPAKECSAARQKRAAVRQLCAGALCIDECCRC